MTAASKDVLEFRSGADDITHPSLRSFPVDASKKIYAGTIVGLSTTGWAGPADGATYTVVVGVCQKQTDNSSGAAGALQVPVCRGSFGHLAQTGTTIDKTKVNQKVYAVDDSTVSLSSSGNAIAGFVDFVDTQSGVVFYLIGCPQLA